MRRYQFRVYTSSLSPVLIRTVSSNWFLVARLWRLFYQFAGCWTTYIKRVC